jgi:hypothetical protein
VGAEFGRKSERPPSRRFKDKPGAFKEKAPRRTEGRRKRADDDEFDY